MTVNRNPSPVPAAPEPSGLGKILGRLREPVFVAQLAATVGFLATVLGMDWITPEKVTETVAAALAWYGVAAVLARQAVVALKNLQDRF